MLRYSYIVCLLFFFALFHWELKCPQLLNKTLRPLSDWDCCSVISQRFPHCLIGGTSGPYRSSFRNNIRTTLPHYITDSVRLTAFRTRFRETFKNAKILFISFRSLFLRIWEIFPLLNFSGETPGFFSRDRILHRGNVVSVKKCSSFFVISLGEWTAIAQSVWRLARG